MDLVKNTRPLVFRLPNEAEIAATIKMQKVAKGRQARNTMQAMKNMACENTVATTSDWRLARNRLAKVEIEEDHKHEKEHELQMPREDVIARVFVVLDDNSDKALNQKEFHAFV